MQQVKKEAGAKGNSAALIFGDMIGDKPLIGESHLMRAGLIFPELLARAQKTDKFVVAIGAGSGAGKSEIGALTGSRFIQAGLPAYVLSCDNYPHLPPRTNEKQRTDLFAAGGEQALRQYLGTTQEIDFHRLEGIVAAFKRGEPQVDLRIINNPENRVEFERKPLDVSGLKVLVLEGTWSHKIAGVDCKVFLATNPEETKAHRIARARDKGLLEGEGFKFTEMVLKIEQETLDRLKQQADLVINMKGELQIKK